MRALAFAVVLLASGLAARGEAPRVYPSGEDIPENLLRVSIAFASPTAPGIFERLALRGTDGVIVAQPFLEQELWSPDGKTLTLLLHPGRVKSGLRAHAEAGRALHSGDRVALLLDGEPLTTWRVGPARKSAPDPRRWSINAPRAGTRDAVVLTLDAPIDALAAGSLAVISPRGEKMRGRAVLALGEQSWSLAPETNWEEGPYRILIHPRLEDPQGNALRSGFEQTAGLSSPDAAAPAELRFEVGPAAAARPTQ